MELNLIAQFGGLIWTVMAFVVALSIIVAIHEYGHYIVGRWCGIKADVFSIGFGPVLASRMDKHGTRWQIAALPLGGYVKFRGDADASSVGADGDALAGMSEAERAETMTGAALWKRAATVAAGPAFNFILSIAVFAAFVMFSGRAIETPVIGAVTELPPEIEFLQEGDEVITMAGAAIESLPDLHARAGDLTDMPTVAYKVLRDGAEIEVEAAAPLLPRASSVQPRSAAWEAGIRPGDYIRSINGETVTTFRDMQDATANGDGAPMELAIWRPGEAEDMTVTLVPRRMDLPLPEGGFETRWLMGLSGDLAFESPTEAANPIEALSYGVDQTYFIIRSSLSAIKHIVIGQISTCNLSGPIGIAETSGAAATLGASNFIWFIAVLSAAVGLLNLFPIPVLDGGHLVFHAYEAVRGKPPSDNAVRYLMMVGIGLMAALMLFALFNDLLCP